MRRSPSIPIASGIAECGGAEFALPDIDAELAVHLIIGHFTVVLVENIDEALGLCLSAGGEAVQPPFDIVLGRCATDRERRVVGVAPRPRGGERG
jgi:hypothetical protein